MAEMIKISGLSEFNRNLRKMDADLPKGLRIALNEAAKVIVDYAQARVPVKTGRARRSVKARSTRTAVRVVGGGTKVPYYPWLDFGGTIRMRNRHQSIERPFLKEGRYIYAGFYAKRTEFERVLVEQLLKVAKSAGVEVE